MNSMIYELGFPDVQVNYYEENFIANNMLSQVYDEGYSVTLVGKKLNYKRDDSAVYNTNKYVFTRIGQRWLRKKTQGWKLRVVQKDGSKTCIHIKDTKEENPVHVAELAKAKGIDDEPEFSWWLPYTLRKRDVIIS